MSHDENEHEHELSLCASGVIRSAFAQIGVDFDQEVAHPGGVRVEHVLTAFKILGASAVQLADCLGVPTTAGMASLSQGINEAVAAGRAPRVGFVSTRWSE